MTITVKKRTVKDKYHIYINVHAGGKYPVERPATGVKINKSHWNKTHTREKKNWVSTKDKDYKQKNEQIFKKLIEVEAQYHGIKPSQIIQQAKKTIGGRKTVLNYAREDWLPLVRNLTTRTNKSYGVNKLEKYLEEIDNVGLQFKDVDKKFVTKYYNWMLSHVKPGSANEYLNNFQTIYNQALNDTSFKFDSRIDPFKKFKKEPSKTVNTPLTKDEIDKFLNVDIPKNKPKYANAHALFAFQLWGAFRFKDVYFLRWNNFKIKDQDIYIDFWTKKSSGRERVTRMVPYPVLERMLVKLLKFQDYQEWQYIDAYQKKIAELDKDGHLQNIIEGNHKPKTDMEILIELLENGTFLDKAKEIVANKRGNEKHHPNYFEVNRLRNEQKKTIMQLFRRVIKAHADEYVFDDANIKNVPHPDDWITKDDEQQYKNAHSRNWNALQKLQELCGIDTNLSSHVSRHSATQYLLDSGESHHAIGEYLTHSSLGTLEKYRKRLGTNNNNLGDKLGKLFE